MIPPPPLLGGVVFQSRHPYRPLRLRWAPLAHIGLADIGRDAHVIAAGNPPPQRRTRRGCADVDQAIGLQQGEIRKVTIGEQRLG